MAALKGNPEWLALASADPEFAEAISKAGGPPPAHTANVPALRAIMEKRDANRRAVLASQGLNDSAGIMEHDISIPMRDGAFIRARVFVPEAADAGGRNEKERPLVVMLHGGGFCLGNWESEETNCRLFVREYGCVCVSVDYRLAPEHPFPTPVNDGWDAVKWCAANAPSLPANPSAGFIVGGTSAGGNMSAVIGILARDSCLSPPITGLLLMIPPVMDHRAIPKKYSSQVASYTQNRDAPMLNHQLIELFTDAYAPDLHSQLYNLFAPLHPDAAEPKDPDFTGLPPTHFQICGMDPLRDEALVYEACLKQVGVKTKKIVYPGVPHGFSEFMPQLEVSKNYVKDTVAGLGWLLEQAGK